MISYRYQALDNAGNRREGLRVARDEAVLVEFLHQRGWTPLSVEMHRSFRLRTRDHKKSLSRFFRNLHLFLKSDMDLVPALKQVADRTGDEQMKACVQTVVSDLEAGRSLGDSMRQCEPYFPVSAHRLCAVGERAGRLAETANELAFFYRTQHEFLDEIYNLLLYPLIVLSTGTVVLLFVLTYVLPRLRGLFRNQQTSLPWITRWLFTLSDFAQGWGGILLVVLLATGIYLGRRFFHTETGEQMASKILLNSTLYRKMKMSLFCMAMATSTRMDLKVTRALDLGKDVLGNPLLVQRMEKVKESVRSGQTLTDSLKNSGFTTLPLDSLTAGEQTGNLSEVFSVQAELLSEEVSDDLRRLVTLFEPALILAMTLFVGLVLLAVMWPIVNLTSAL